ncbi:MAG TPA: NAD-dependent epimerase/dehydratase family protein [Acidimicrobiales bacterium]|nr:NAD-dependent epimerase/dehydratase family protein [Acidimicrobiales bacterium]
MTALVTGGAGFIGSHLVDRLLADGEEVRVLDNFSTGRRENLSSAVDLYEGDILDEELVRKAVKGADVVFHQAALTSVARSVEQPLATGLTNTHGTLNLLVAARDAGARRVVYASSSSVYGGVGPLPSTETGPTCPRSPYSASKLAAEQYCRVFSELYGLGTVALRYFNVYGPRQAVGSAYAAAVPLFIQALCRGEAPVVHGDGRQSRDFTFVEDVVEANLAAANAPPEAVGHVFNVARGSSQSLLELLEILSQLLGARVDPVHREPRPGDVRQSMADVRAARELLGFQARVAFHEGLRRTVEWFRPGLGVGILTGGKVPEQHRAHGRE